MNATGEADRSEYNKTVRLHNRTVEALKAARARDDARTIAKAEMILAALQYRLRDLARRIDLP
jgi:hypothetical protein